MAFNVNHLLGDPMANVAMAYGSSIASHGKDMVHKEVWPAPWARVAGFLARAGHHGIPPNAHSSPQGRSTQRSTQRFGVQLAHSLLSPLPAAPFCVCEQTEVFFCCGHSLCGEEARATGLPLHTPGELAGSPASPMLPQSLAPDLNLLLSSLVFSSRPGRCCHCQNWEVQYSRDAPLPPRRDLNAPDLYIPSESLTWAGGRVGTCALRHQ